jgi:hypothetical protein
MRTMIGKLMVAGVITVGGGLACAQDATMMATQAAQQSMDMAVQASQQAMDAMNQASQLAMQQTMQASIDNSMSVAAARPALPATPRPVISKVKGGVSVVLYDADPKAIVFYTMDGSLPTLRSQRYAGPIMVSSKVRVRAMAFDLADMPSGVVSKTIRVKS